VRASRAVALLVVLLASAASVSAASPAGAVTHTLIEGSGSAWGSNAIDQWIAAVQPEGLMVTYTPDGSLAGEQAFEDHTGDFAVAARAYLGGDLSKGREYGAIPIAAAALTFPYQVRFDGNQVRTLRLSGRTVAKIFTNRITNWDDPAITADNNGVQLPSIPITVVVQAERSEEHMSSRATSPIATQRSGRHTAGAPSRRRTTRWILAATRSRKTAATAR